VDVSWEEGRLTKAVIHSKFGLPCEVVCGDQSWEFNTKAGKCYPLKLQQRVDPRNDR
jgi:alpha-L-fucosidase 2